jgi:hypothetical protein
MYDKILWKEIPHHLTRGSKDGGKPWEMWKKHEKTTVSTKKWRRSLKLHFITRYGRDTSIHIPQSSSSYKVTEETYVPKHML